jgi:hypothetical protein
MLWRSPSSSCDPAVQAGTKPRPPVVDAVVGFEEGRCA